MEDTAEIRIFKTEGGISCQQEIEQDRKVKAPEPGGVSVRNPGTRWVAEQVAPEAADGAALVAVPKVADAARAVVVDEGDK